MSKKIMLALAVIAVMAVCSSRIALGAYAQTSAVNPTSTTISTPSPNPITSKGYIRIDGVINKWGTTPATGLIQTQAKVATFTNSNTAQLAAATAIWTTNLTRPISAVISKENFTYTYYAARLRNASVSALSASTSSTNYILNGTWNVFTVVNNVTVYTNADGAITRIHRSSDTTIEQAFGTLNVTDNWTKFTLSINGINPLTGSVLRWVQRAVQFNPFSVTESVSNVVTRADVSAVAQAYGSSPGYGNYNPSLDVCGHFKIDICDLSTVAANVGSS